MILRIIAILGAVAAVVLFVLIGNQKEELQNELDDTRMTLRTTERNLSTVRGEKEELEGNVAELNTNLEESQAEVSSLQSQLTRTRRELAEANQIISARERDAEAARAEAARIRRELREAREEAERTVGTAEAGAQEAQRRIARLEQQLRAVEAGTQPETAPEDPLTGEPTYVRRPPVRGEVTEVDRQSNFIVINVGAGDNLRKDSILIVRRGAKMVARARLADVQETQSIAQVYPGGERIQAGDLIIAYN